MEFLKKRWKQIAAILVSIVLVVVAGFYMYTLDYYRALPTATEALTSGIVQQEIENNMIVFSPQGEQVDTGIIFYPGGKVDYLAYVPLMQQIAQRGYTCFLMKMPFNLAVFDQDAADKPLEMYTDITSWYMAGHSLGGAMSSLYLEKHLDKFDGLILLGAYPAADLSTTDLHMFSIYGSEDDVLNRETMEENKLYGPKDSVYFEIQGGNHAYYGSYGEQKKDGIATISDMEQQAITTREIVDFIKTYGNTK